MTAKRRGDRGAKVLGLPTQPVRLSWFGHNAEGAPEVTITHGACPIGVEVYTTPARLGAPTWSSREHDLTTPFCMNAQQFVQRVRGNSTIEFVSEFFSGADIGAPATPTRYYYVVVYRDRAGVHRVSAGDDALSR